MPQLGILDLLTETEQWLDLHKLFGPLSGFDAKQAAPDRWSRGQSSRWLPPRKDLLDLPGTLNFVVVQVDRGRCDRRVTQIVAHSR
jgi:hypothetical protein